VFGGESVVDVAKELVEWQKKLPALQLKGAYLDGTVLDPKQAAGLAKMPTLKELKGQVAGSILAAIGSVAAASVGPGSAVAGAVKGLVDKLEKQAA
jgi:large subunit ribosomal protein L10